MGLHAESLGTQELGIRKTPKQLAEALGEPVPEGKIASRPYWDKYLAAFHRADEAEKRRRTHLQERLRSLDIIIESLEAESRDTTAFKKEREYVLSVPEWDIDHADVPAIHPDAEGGYHGFPSRSSLRSTSIHERMSSKSTMLLS